MIFEDSNSVHTVVLVLVWEWSMLVIIIVWYGMWTSCVANVFCSMSCIFVVIGCYVLLIVESCQHCIGFLFNNY